jgi:hypothetical protein
MTDTTPDLSRHLHRKDLTFRQAEGVDPLPKMLAYGELDQKLRIKIWDELYLFFARDMNDNGIKYLLDTHNYAVYLCRSAFSMSVDDAIKFADNVDKFFTRLKQAILTGSYVDCLEIVTCVLRENEDRFLKYDLIRVLNDQTSPYQVVDFPPLTIIPRGDENERAAFEQNWPAIASSPFGGSKTHFRQAAEALNAGNYPAAMREAIHAVESAVKVVTGNPKAMLGDGLNCQTASNNDPASASNSDPAFRRGLCPLVPVIA